MDVFTVSLWDHPHQHTVSHTSRMLLAEVLLQDETHRSARGFTAIETCQDQAVASHQAPGQSILLGMLLLDSGQNESTFMQHKHEET